MQKLISLLLVMCLLAGTSFAGWPFRDEATAKKTENLLYAIASLGLANAAFKEDSRFGQVVGFTSMYFAGKHGKEAVYGEYRQPREIREAKDVVLADYYSAEQPSDYPAAIMFGALAVWGFSQGSSYGTVSGIIFSLSSVVRFARIAW